MAFRDLFKDENEINEKSIVGFASFVMMVAFGIADIVLGVMGNSFEINQVIYNSFVMVTLGTFGIAEAGKVFGNGRNK